MGRGYGCRVVGLTDVGYRVVGLWARLWHGSGTVPGTVLAPFLPLPALAMAVRPLRICTRPHRAHARTWAPPCTHPAPGYTGRHPSMVNVPVDTSPAARHLVGLTLGCTSGQTSRACHLARYPHPVLPADRVPTARTLCHSAPGHNGQQCH